MPNKAISANEPSVPRKQNDEINHEQIIDDLQLEDVSPVNPVYMTDEGGNHSLAVLKVDTETLDVKTTDPLSPRSSATQTHDLVKLWKDYKTGDLTHTTFDDIIQNASTAESDTEVTISRSALSELADAGAQILNLQAQVGNEAVVTSLVDAVGEADDALDHDRDKRWATEG